MNKLNALIYVSVSFSQKSSRGKRALHERIYTICANCMCHWWSIYGYTYKALQYQCLLVRWGSLSGRFRFSDSAKLTRGTNRLATHCRPHRLTRGTASPRIADPTGNSAGKIICQAWTAWTVQPAVNHIKARVNREFTIIENLDALQNEETSLACGRPQAPARGSKPLLHII